MDKRKSLIRAIEAQNKSGKKSLVFFQKNVRMIPDCFKPECYKKMFEISKSDLHKNTTNIALNKAKTDGTTKNQICSKEPSH